MAPSLSSVGPFLKLGWSKIAERGMATLPVVKDLNGVKYIYPDFLSGVVLRGMNEFHLEGVEETFGYESVFWKF